MACYLIVVNSVELLGDLLTERETSCPVSEGAEVGDNLFIYATSNRRTRRLRHHLGIVARCEIVARVSERAGDWVDMGRTTMGGGKLVRARVKLVERFPHSLEGVEMRKDLILSRSSFLRRNFRGACFRVSRVEAVHVRSLLASANSIEGADRTE